MTIVISLRLLAAIIGLVAAFFGLRAALQKLKTWNRRNRLLRDAEAAEFLRQFNNLEIKQALENYIVPSCSPADPSNREGEEYLADTREPVFAYIDRTLQASQRAYHLILADTGMGKTTFCLNYFAHAKAQFSDLNVCLVSLTSDDAGKAISAVVNKSSTILIADALDEDKAAFGRGRDRLAEILSLGGDFKAVIVTCRSQFFLADDAIPRETPLAVLVPRKLGQSPTFPLIRSYIAPFSAAEVQKYISKHFPRYAFWRFKQRSRALQLVAAVPELSHRPMLLERLPELARSSPESTELYDLYNMLVDGWIDRESRWIRVKDLKQVSIELAIYMYTRLEQNGGRHTVSEINDVARRTMAENPDWKHLTSRSLLNRDSQGKFKFAHKSIMEFLVVKAACEGDQRPTALKWTAFMKEMLVSWGHSKAGIGQSARAKEMLSSEHGRINISPLFDLYATAPLRGLPDFKRCAERKLTWSGERVAPMSWRSSSIDIDKQAGGVTAVHDAEYNLDWIYIVTNKRRLRGSHVNLLEVLKRIEKNPTYRLPSYEQFITFLEGVHKAAPEILVNGSMFLTGDKPSSREYLVVQLNGEPISGPALKLIDKKRKISGTSMNISSYITGVRINHEFAKRVTVEQLYLQDRSGLLL